MRAVGVGHVLGDRREAADVMTAAMHPDPRASLKDFDGRGRESKIDGLVNEPMRHGVEMALDVDVIVDVHARLAPFGVDEALGRQRPQRRLIEAREEIPAGGPAVPFHRPGVEIREELADPRVQRARARRRSHGAAGRGSSVGRPARRLRLWPCREVSPVLRAKSPSCSGRPIPRTCAGGSVRSGRRRGCRS